MSLDERAGRKRQRRLFAVLAFGWLALMAVLVFEPCCETLAAMSTDTHPDHADEHGDHAPTPCEVSLASHLDINGPAPASVAGGPDIDALVLSPIASSSVFAIQTLPPHRTHGPDPPYPIYLTLLRLLI